MIGKKGKDLVSIPAAADRHPAVPLRPEGLRRRRPGRRRRRPAARPAAGRRRRRRRRSAGRAHPRSRADDGGDGRHPRRGAGPAAHRAARQEEHRHHPRQVHRHPPGRPRVAAPLQAHLQAGPEAPDRLRHLRPRRADGRPDPRGQAVPQLEGSPEARERRRHHLHDGRVRLDDRRAEGDRPHRGVLDRHLDQGPLQGRRDGLHHPRRRRPGGGRAHLLPHARERRHQDQLGLRAVPTRSSTSPLPAGPVEHLRLPLLRRRQLGRRHPALHRDADGEAAAEGEPVRLRAGGKPLRQRRVLRVHPRDARRARQRGVQPDPRPRRDPGVDQGVSRAREDDRCRSASRSDLASSKRSDTMPTRRTTPTCRPTCAPSRRRSRATRAATASTSTRRSSRSSTPTTSTRSRPTAASRRATRTGRSAWRTRS